MKNLNKFLSESNKIEGVFDEDSLMQARYAWAYLYWQSELSIPIILKTHEFLMRNHLGKKDKGKFRKRAIYIGYREGLHWPEILGAMKHWINKANESKTWKEIKQDHIDYEHIHPFIDGNGRTGRIFMNWQRMENRLPIKVIENKKKQDYYKWF